MKLQDYINFDQKKNNQMLLTYFNFVKKVIIV